MNNRLWQKTCFFFLDKLGKGHYEDQLKGCINKSISSFKENDFRQSMKECRIALECLFHILYENKGVEFDPNKNTLDGNIKNFLYEWENVIGAEAKRALYLIKDEGNKASHVEQKGSMEVGDHDVLTILKRLHFILLSSFEKVVDYEIYVDEVGVEREVKFSTKNISIVTKEAAVTEEFIQTQKESKTNENESLDIKKVSVARFLMNPKFSFKVPVYQRKYVWDSEYCGYLFEDIIKRSEKSEEHYLGTIAYKTLSKNDNETVIKIIDGQQRLTTSIILMRAIYDTYNNLYDGKTGTIDQSLTFIFENYKNKPLFTNPGATSIENDKFKDVMLGRLKGKPVGRFQENYVYFMDRLSTMTIDGLHVFWTSFLDNFIFAATDFMDITNKKEMEIFENMNSLSAQLTTYDIIKNQFMNLCSEDTIDSEQDQQDIAKKYNHIIEMKFANVKSEKYNYDEWMKNIFSYIRGQEFGNDISKKKFASYALEYITSLGYNNEMTINEFESMLHKFNKYLLITKSLSFKNYKNNVLSCVKEFLPFIPTAKHKAFLPFLYFAIDKYNLYDETQTMYRQLSKEEEIELKEYFLNAFDLIAFHASVKGQGDSSFARNINIEVHKQKNNPSKGLTIIKNVKNDISSSLDRVNVEASLIERNRTGAAWSWRYLVFKLTYNMTNQAKFKTEIVKPQVEHFMPKEPKIWMEDIMSWNKIGDRGLAEVRHAEYLEYLGNLFILPGPLNGSIKNKDLKTKISKLEPYKHLLPLYYSNNESIDISSRDEFTFDDIKKRSEALMKLIMRNTALYN